MVILDRVRHPLLLLHQTITSMTIETITSMTIETERSMKMETGGRVIEVLGETEAGAETGTGTEGRNQDVTDHVIDQGRVAMKNILYIGHEPVSIIHYPRSGFRMWF